MKLFVHADDIGLTEATTNDIVECLENGWLNSASILANGYSFEHAIETVLKSSRNYRLVTHLNFVEGETVLPANEVPSLVDGEGRLNNTFQSLLFWYSRLNETEQAEMQQQLKAEARAQILKIRNALNDDGPLFIDGHQHLHVLPFVFNGILELKEEFEIEYIRTPGERFFMHINELSDLGNYLGLNIVKNKILNYFLQKNDSYEKLDAAGIDYSHHFVGMLFAGCMKESAVHSALPFLGEGREYDGTVEILFHPGRALDSEKHVWRGDQKLINYYCSEDRAIEKKRLAESSFLQNLIAEHRK